MSLRNRIFALFGTMLVLLFAAEWWLVHALGKDVQAESEQVALEVGRSVASIVARRWCTDCPTT
jgi:sensor histidine kinase regulating citrate/malate metabolism